MALYLTGVALLWLPAVITARVLMRKDKIFGAAWNTETEAMSIALGTVAALGWFIIIPLGIIALIYWKTLHRFVCFVSNAIIKAMGE